MLKQTQLLFEVKRQSLDNLKQEWKVVETKTGDEVVKI